MNTELENQVRHLRGQVESNLADLLEQGRIVGPAHAHVRGEIGKVRNELEFALHLFRKFQPLEIALDLVPTETLEAYQARYHGIVEHASRARDAVHNRDKFDSELKETVAAIQAFYRAFDCGMGIAFVAESASEFESVTEYIKGSLGEPDADPSSQTVFGRLAKHEKAIGEVRQAVAKAAVAKRSSKYEARANELRTRSLWAIILVCGQASVLFAIAYFFLLDRFQLIGLDHFRSLAPGVLPIAAILVIGISICIKVYLANSHLEEVHRQRQLSLDLFPDMIASSEDPQVREVILIRACDALFRSEKTGFIRDNGDSGESPLALLSLLEQLRR